MLRLQIAALAVSVFVLAGCATQAAPAAAGPVADGGWLGGQTSIAYPVAPGSVAPTTVVVTSAAGGPPVDAGLQQIRPGEVWCKVVRPAVYDERVEQVPLCGPRWEWRRTTECDVPGAAPVSANPAQAAPGQVWCYVQVPGTYETKTTRLLLCPERVEWRRTTECDVPPVELPRVGTIAGPGTQ